MKLAKNRFDLLSVYLDDYNKEGQNETIMCVMIVAVMQARFGQAHRALALLVQRRGAILQS